MAARDQDAHRAPRNLPEKSLQPAAILPGKHRKAGERRPLRPIEGRRNPPDSTATGAHLGMVFFLVLHQPVWRIRNNGVDRILWRRLHPTQSIHAGQCRPWRTTDNRRSLLPGKPAPVRRSSILDSICNDVGRSLRDRPDLAHRIGLVSPAGLSNGIMLRPIVDPHFSKQALQSYPAARRSHAEFLGQGRIQPQADHGVLAVLILLLICRWTAISNFL